MEHYGCEGCKYDKYPVDSHQCKGCIHNAVDKYVPQSNGDRIRDMTDTELAEYLSKQKWYMKNTEECYSWLKSVEKE